MCESPTGRIADAYRKAGAPLAGDALPTPQDLAASLVLKRTVPPEIVWWWSPDGSYADIAHHRVHVWGVGKRWAWIAGPLGFIGTVDHGDEGTYEKTKEAGRRAAFTLWEIENRGGTQGG